MSYYLLHHDISFGEVKRWLSPSRRLSWFHYFIAAFVSYLTVWLVGFVWMFYYYFVSAHPFNKFHPERDSFDISFSSMLWMTIPAAINFLILLPFLRFPVRRRIAYVFLCAGWLFILWFFQADT